MVQTFSSLQLTANWHFAVSTRKENEKKNKANSDSMKMGNILK